MDITRIDQELDILRRRYTKVECGDNYQWIIIRDFTLPQGWNFQKTNFMLEIPSAYPATPPDKFYVDEGLKVKATDKSPVSYTEGVEKFGKKWGRFSWHIEGEWQPHADPKKGDNLLTFVLRAERRLKELE